MMETTFDKIDSSMFFLALGTDDYLKEVLSPGTLAEQIKMAKALKKPVLLMVERHLSDEQKSQLRDLFSEFDIVREVEFDKDAIGSTDDKLLEALKELSAQ